MPGAPVWSAHATWSVPASSSAMCGWREPLLGLSETLRTESNASCARASPGHTVPRARARSSALILIFAGPWIPTHASWLLPMRSKSDRRGFVSHRGPDGPYSKHLAKPRGRGECSQVVADLDESSLHGARIGAREG